MWARVSARVAAAGVPGPQQRPTGSALQPRERVRGRAVRRHAAGSYRQPDCGRERLLAGVTRIWLIITTWLADTSGRCGTDSGQV